MHSVMSHGDTITDTDRIELHRGSACSENTVLYGTCDVL